VFPVGTELALTIEVNNYRLECRGTVRLVYPGLGMGIFFTTMAEEHRERLRQLIRSVNRPSALMGSEPASMQRAATPRENSPSTGPDPQVALAAISNFFEDRQMLSRDEFLRILRKSQE
jgi:hypothetical protein